MLTNNVFAYDSAGRDRLTEAALSKGDGRAEWARASQQQNGTNYFYLRDHLGSVREMVNASGSIVSEAIYDPYGVATVSGSVIPSFQYAGYYAHQGSGLNLTWYRSYDPVIGRWQARDPIGIKGGINLYGYVGNNPVNLWDPLGLSPSDWWDIPAKIGRAQEIANDEKAKHHGHNDCDDANRHAEWSKRMADELGGWFSDLVGTGHELEGLLNRAPFDETVMDLNNNKEGRNSSREGRNINQNNLRTAPTGTTGVGGPY